jgi:hypothetical protein
VRVRLLQGVSLVFLVSAVACDLNPQPLPPGEQPDSGNSETVPGGGSGSGGNGETGSSDAGGGPLGLGDAGALAPDAAALDGAVDAAVDGSSDAALDAGGGSDGSDE